MGTKLYSALLVILFFAGPIAHSTPFAKVYAAGLTYSKHIRSSSEKFDPKKPVIFVKKPQSYLFAEKQQREVAMPNDAQIYPVIRGLDPELASEIASNFSEVPKMLDYEAEIGLLFKRDVKAEELDGKYLGNAVALFVANDVSLRSLQVMGDGKANKLRFWSAAKSFPGFMPYSAPRNMRVFPLKVWNLFHIKTFVTRGKQTELRQDDTTADLIYSPELMLKALLEKTGGAVIPAGTALLTGTPDGTAFKVPAYKRFFGNFVKPIKKLKIAADDALANPDFLVVGDVVRVEVEGIGSNEVKIIR